MELITRIFSFFYNLVHVRAASSNCAVGSSFDPSCPPNIPTILGQVSTTLEPLIFGLGPVLLVVMIVYAGYTRLTAAENQKKVIESNQTIMWAVLGYGVVLGAVLIIRLVASMLGYDPGSTINVNI